MCLVAGIGHEVPTVRNLATHHDTDSTVDMVDAGVGTGYKEFRENLFFSSEDHSILTLNSNNCST